MHTNFGRKTLREEIALWTARKEKGNIKWILNKYGLRVRKSCDSGQKLVAGSCEHGNKLLGSITGDHFLDMLSHCNSFST
jgi:hypothetical protein